MTTEILVQIGGLYHIGFGVLHLSFPKLFKWKKSLVSLDKSNYALIYVMHIYLMCMFFLLGSIQLFKPSEFLNNSLGTYLLSSFSLLWFIRAGLQIKYFKLKEKSSIIMLIIFLIGSILFLSPIYFH